MTIQRHLTPTKLKSTLGTLLLFLLDFLSLLLVFHLAVLLRQHILPRFVTGLPDYRYEFGLYWWIFPVWLGIMFYEEAYSKRFAVWDEVKVLWKSSFFFLLTMLLLLFLMKRGHEYSRLLIATMFLLSLMLLPWLRLRAKRIFYSLGLLRRKILIIGSGKSAIGVYKSVTGEPNLGYEVAGFIDDSPAPEKIDCFKVHRGIGKIERYIKSADIHDVAIAKPELEKSSMSALINRVQHAADNTLYIPDISGIAVSGTELRHFFKEQTLVIEIKNNLAQPLIYLAKRTIDYAATAFITGLLALPMLVIMLLIKISSPGPATYRQERIGKNGRKFWCYKFRTMYPDATARLKEILASDPVAKAEWDRSYKLTKDPRVTPVGDFLRKTSLDELPQLFNILKGEMSLVGPRPVVREEIDKYYRDDAVFYFRVPPGLTGLWQVSGRSDTTYEYRVSLDCWYVKNWNLWLDIMIFFKTVDVVLRREGAR